MRYAPQVMALTSTLYRFELELADVDRGVYETLEMRVPCHPSEDEERLVVRVLARCLSHEEGLDFGRGLSHTEDAALWTQSAAGIDTWIDVGAPSADRLHRASKRAAKVLVYTHKQEASLLKDWTSRAIHQADAIDVVQFPAELVVELASWLDRTNRWHVTLNEGQLNVSSGDRCVLGAVRRVSLAEFIS